MVYDIYESVVTLYKITVDVKGPEEAFKIANATAYSDWEMVSSEIENSWAKPKEEQNG